MRPRSLVRSHLQSLILRLDKYITNLCHLKTRLEPNVETPCISNVQHNNGRPIINQPLTQTLENLILGISQRIAVCLNIYISHRNRQTNVIKKLYAKRFSPTVMNHVH
jgi:hypothetical protein